MIGKLLSRLSQLLGSGPDQAVTSMPSADSDETTDLADPSKFELEEEFRESFGLVILQTTRIQLAAGEKPSIAMVSNLTSSVQLSLQAGHLEAAREAVQLLLTAFEEASDLQVGHTRGLEQLSAHLASTQEHAAAISCRETIVRTRKRFLGSDHSGVWTAQAELAEALWKAKRLAEARDQIAIALQAAANDSSLVELQTASRGKLVAKLESVAGVIELAEKKYAIALDHFQRAMNAVDGSIDPLNGIILKLNTGRSLVGLGRVDEAAEILASASAAIASHPSGTDSQFSRVAVLIAQEMRELGAPQLAALLSSAVPDVLTTDKNEDELLQQVKKLLTQAGPMKMAGRLNDAARLYAKCLGMLAASESVEARQLRAMVLDNTLGLFTVRYGLAQQSGSTVGPEEPIGEFVEDQLIAQTESAFGEAFNDSAVDVALFNGNLAILHSMAGRVSDAEKRFHRCFEILDTHSGGPYVDRVRNAMEIERANMQSIHRTSTSSSSSQVGAVEFRKLDDAIVRTKGRFGFARLNQLNLWASQLFQNGDLEGAMEFSKTAADVAKAQIQLTVDHAQAEHTVVFSFEPVSVRDAFRLRFQLLAIQTSLPGSPAMDLPDMEELYEAAQLAMASNLAAAFTSSQDNGAATRSLLAAPFTIADTQAVLRASEHLIVIPRTEMMAAFVLTTSTVKFVPLPLHVLSLGFRQSTGSAFEPFKQADPFQMLSLSRNIMPQLAPLLSEASHAIFATDTGLCGFPLCLLRWPPTGGEIDESSELLVDRMAMSLTASVQSFVRERRLDRPAPHGSGFLGIASPDLGTIAPHVDGGTLAKLFEPLGANHGLASLSALPQMVGIVTAIATSPGATESSRLLLGSEASKDEILALSRSKALREFRTICFATHGLTAEELRTYGIDQPALLLASPHWKEAVHEKDEARISSALLTMKEIEELELDADIVILTACNTAASSGEQISDALSGLAAAFIRAGARSTLVSLWAADADATELFVSALYSEQNREVSRAEAMRQAMTTVRDDPSGRYAAPGFWAGFVLVGDGAEPLRV